MKIKKQIKETADSCYRAKAAELQKKLEILNAKLAQHAKQQALEPSNWGYVGDLGHYTELINQILGIEEA